MSGFTRMRTSRLDCKTSMPTVKLDCITTSSGITSLMRGGLTRWGYLFQQSFIWEKGRHIAGHNNFITGRSILTANPQDLFDSFHQGNIQSSKSISQNKEKVHFMILEVVLIRIQEMRLRQNGE